MNKELLQDRMPPLSPEKMTEAQRKAAAELAAGPCGAVRGPFIPLLRSPEVMSRLQRVGEYLRYPTVLEPRLGEFVILIVARQWTQQFEWCVHYPLARTSSNEGHNEPTIPPQRRVVAARTTERRKWDLPLLKPRSIRRNELCDGQKPVKWLGLYAVQPNSKRAVRLPLHPEVRTCN